MSSSSTRSLSSWNNHLTLIDYLVAQPFSYLDDRLASIVYLSTWLLNFLNNCLTSYNVRRKNLKCKSKDLVSDNFLKPFENTFYNTGSILHFHKSQSIKHTLVIYIAFHQEHEPSLTWTTMISFQNHQHLLKFHWFISCCSRHWAQYYDILDDFFHHSTRSFNLLYNRRILLHDHLSLYMIVYFIIPSFNKSIFFQSLVFRHESYITSQTNFSTSTYTNVGLSRICKKNIKIKSRDWNLFF